MIWKNYTIHLTFWRLVTFFLLLFPYIWISEWKYAKVIITSLFTFSKHSCLLFVFWNEKIQFSLALFSSCHVSNVMFYHTPSLIIKTTKTLIFPILENEWWKTCLETAIQGKLLLLRPLEIPHDIKECNTCCGCILLYDTRLENDATTKERAPFCCPWNVIIVYFVQNQQYENFSIKENVITKVSHAWCI